jgi:nicotinamidase-related amidase
MGITVLLVVDIQNAILDDHPYQEKELISNVQTLLGHCRNKGLEVVYVRHNSKGDGSIKINTRPWQIGDEISPMPGEKIFDKCYCSSFRETGLKEYLDSKGVDTIILAGMQTEYCIDTTCRVAFELGYQVFVPEGAVTTLDNDMLKAEQINNYFLHRIWNDTFAQVKSVKEICEM